MSQKYHGTINELKDVVKAAGIQGVWKQDGSGKQIFRSEGGGVLNWWRNGTINFQGNDSAKGVLERTLQKLLAGSCNSSCAKPESVTQNASDPVTAYQPQSRLQSNGDTPSLLKRVKDALASSGLTVMLVSDSTYIVRDSEYDQSCSLVHQGSEIYIRKL